MPIIVVVLDDVGYGAEVHYTRGRGVPDSLARLPHPPLDKIAAAFGMDYRRIEDLDELGVMQELASGHGAGPLILHVPLHQDSASRFFHDYSSVEKVPAWGAGDDT